MSADAATNPRRANRVLLAKLLLVTVVMFGFAFLLVPFYDQISKATGLRNIDAPDPLKRMQIDFARSVRLELDANASRLPWRFRPLTPIMSVHPGEIATVLYEVENTSEHALTGQAVPSYGPQLAAQYIRKLACFCFSTQALAPHEKREMPVVFVVDPKLPKDVATITLSYTFFEVEGNQS